MDDLDVILAQAKALRDPCKIALGAVLAERLFPKYAKWRGNPRFCDPTLYADVLSIIGACAKGQQDLSETDMRILDRKMAKRVPSLEEVGDPNAVAAADAFLLALKACIKPDAACSVCEVAIKVAGSESPYLLEDDWKFWSVPGVQAEVRLQTKLIELLASVENIDDLTADRLRAVALLQRSEIG